MACSREEAVVPPVRRITARDPAFWVTAGEGSGRRSGIQPGRAKLDRLRVVGDLAVTRTDHR
jgi:hypothetical protein